ncbi:hypothetical protein DFH06DRAFT_1160311 [Mycena polygramma]|nr:hypothetical protein DFH06DRAFT_1160311 [Mycena polygramma]
MARSRRFRGNTEFVSAGGHPTLHSRRRTTPPGDTPPAATPPLPTRPNAWQAQAHAPPRQINISLTRVRVESAVTKSVHPVRRPSADTVLATINPSLSGPIAAYNVVAVDPQQTNFLYQRQDCIQLVPQQHADALRFAVHDATAALAKTVADQTEDARLLAQWQIAEQRCEVDFNFLSTRLSVMSSTQLYLSIASESWAPRSHPTAPRSANPCTSFMLRRATMYTATSSPTPRCRARICYRCASASPSPATSLLTL